MAFYGAATDSKLVQIGLVVQDTACTDNELKKLSLERRRSEISDYIDDSEGVDYAEIAILAFATLVIFSIIVFVTVTCIIRMRNAKVARVVSL